MQPERVWRSPKRASAACEPAPPPPPPQRTSGEPHRTRGELPIMAEGSAFPRDTFRPTPAGPVQQVSRELARGARDARRCSCAGGRARHWTDVGWVRKEGGAAPK